MTKKGCQRGAEERQRGGGEEREREEREERKKRERASTCVKVKPPRAGASAKKA